MQAGLVVHTQQNQVFSQPGSQVINLLWYSTQLSMKLIMLINVKMQTIVGILTFIRRITTKSESLKQKMSLFFLHLNSMSSWNLMLSWVEHEKFYNLRARSRQKKTNNMPIQFLPPQGG